jgi:hypothetical protein
MILLRFCRQDRSIKKRQGLRMSIASISAVSSLATLQQSPSVSGTNRATAVQPDLVQSTAAGQIDAVPEQSAKIHHHHHHGGGGAVAQASEFTQSTTADATGTNILNTLVWN